MLNRQVLCFETMCAWLCRCLAPLPLGVDEEEKKTLISTAPGNQGADKYTQKKMASSPVR